MQIIKIHHIFNSILEKCRTKYFRSSSWNNKGVVLDHVALEVYINLKKDHFAIINSNCRKKIIIYSKLLMLANFRIIEQII